MYTINTNSCFYSSPSCDGDPLKLMQFISTVFLFFPVLRRGSIYPDHGGGLTCFYSSPSCDGDQCNTASVCIFSVSILPRLATGIEIPFTDPLDVYVSILPRLATGIQTHQSTVEMTIVSILPRLATGIIKIMNFKFFCSFYSSPSCDGDRVSDHVDIYFFSFYSSPSCDGDQKWNDQDLYQVSFYSSPSCDGDLLILRRGTVLLVSILPRLATGIQFQVQSELHHQFLFFPVLRRGSTAGITDWSNIEFLFFPVLRRGS